MTLDAAFGCLDEAYDEWLGFDADGGGYNPETDPAAAKKLRFERVPDFNYMLAATYSLPMENGGSLAFRASYDYRDDYYNDAVNSPIIRQDGYGLFDASISYTSANDRLRLTLFGKNLAEEKYFDFALVNAFTTQTWGGTPRTWGVRASYVFE